MILRVLRGMNSPKKHERDGVRRCRHWSIWLNDKTRRYPQSRGALFPIQRQCTHHDVCTLGCVHGHQGTTLWLLLSSHPCRCNEGTTCLRRNEGVGTDRRGDDGGQDNGRNKRSHDFEICSVVPGIYLAIPKIMSMKRLYSRRRLLLSSADESIKGSLADRECCLVDSESFDNHVNEFLRWWWWKRWRLCIL